MKKLKIPEETIERLPLYLRRSKELSGNGEDFVSSQEFVEKLPGISSDNLRKDLSFFGNFGVKGQGYNTNQLLSRLRSILKLQADTKVALIGVGNLGSALLTHKEFSRWGFMITAAFDKDPRVVGSQIGGISIQPIQGLNQTIQNEAINVAMIAVPAGEAQSVANSVVSAGVKGILNFAPVLLDVPQEVQVEQVDITSKLKELNYYLEG
ncbi:MAG: redox-sensing transcriptional repressor Rex [Candidatus Bipolaricaulota bacterium]